MNSQGGGCACGGPLRLVFPCSGAADVGALADTAARRLAKEGVVRMSCLAGVGAGIPSFIEGASGAAAVLAIDGCEKACASKCLREAGVLRLVELNLKELGFQKGSSPNTPSNQDKVMAMARNILPEVRCS